MIAFENRHKLSVSKALIQGEEIERKRIARDLHDGLGSMLSGLKIHLNLAKKEKGEIINGVDTLLDNSIKELRNISQNLMPESLLELSLEHALKDLCAANSNTTTKIEFQYLIKKSKLPKNYEIMIYRIIQELLNNALKYANAIFVSTPDLIEFIPGSILLPQPIDINTFESMKKNIFSL